MPRSAEAVVFSVEAPLACDSSYLNRIWRRRHRSAIAAPHFPKSNRHAGPFCHALRGTLGNDDPVAGPL